ncbi:MAG TPA: cardiolipin synthase [Microbacteriaceae bacterium]|nr:cardiolipin synthase [Microbacteriaceae bacterium]
MEDSLGDGIVVTFEWSPWFTFLLLIIDIGLRVLALVVVPRNRRPQTSMAWLLAIMILPWLGWLIFLLFGSRQVGRQRRRRQDEVNEFIAEAVPDDHHVRLQADWPDWLKQVATLNRRLGAMPFVGGNTFEYFTHYEESIQSMAEAVRQAQRTVHVEFYILTLDDTTKGFFDALAEAVQRDVTVRVLLDHVANLRQPGYRRTLRFLKEHGITWRRMLPLSLWPWRWLRPDLRNHRKLLVVDGEIAYTGSQNMIASSYNKKGNIKRGLHWKDLMVRFEGPIAQSIDVLFITDWYSETGEVLLHEVTNPPPREGDRLVEAQVVPSGPGFSGENNLRLFNSLLYEANQRVIITSPYFVPDDSMLYAITTAAQSGLDVQLFVSEIGDQAMVFHAQRSYYEYLLKAGVRIWLYRSPTILHSKHFTIDDEVAVIGSSNMDMRSFSLNYEISVIVHSADFVRELREIEQQYREDSTELLLEDWQRRPVPGQILDNVMRLTAGLQ